MATTELAERIASELAEPAPPEAFALADVLVRRFGNATAGVLFYGSCLRRQDADGVLDFYVLVDDYRQIYPGRWLAFLNAILPPNVFYLEHSAGGKLLRAKVAVLSLDHFSHAVAPRWAEARVWARFAQPARLLYHRSEEIRDGVVRDVATALQTFVGHLPAWLPDARDEPVTAERFWPAAFRETYRAELRGESMETIQALYDAAPVRYAELLDLALVELGTQGDVSIAGSPGLRRLVASDAEIERARRRWRRRRRLGKAWSTLGLAKCIFTFDDWASYGLWKVERHGGEKIQLSERQRRYPLIFGWPVVWRLLRQRTLR
ncbi:MAG: hypothetical protein JRH01_22935 [Deltaproteobacteria bacterium]|nr:hypothetical protein [Deltaproteobacteria bacterium]MBW2393959.1 hypothetical protein [Deltaproteobacteria bacterium]